MATPMETIAIKLAEYLTTNGATVAVDSLLFDALAGVPRAAFSSGIAVNIHSAGQIYEAQTVYNFTLTLVLTVSVDDDKTGELFRENYETLWNTVNYYAYGDRCTTLGDGETYAVDGFQATSGSEPDYAEDGNGGTWTTSFGAQLTVRIINNEETSNNG